MSEGSSRPTRIATWNPARGVWETPKVALCGHSEVWSETWPAWGMTRSGVAYELPMWEPRTADSGCSSQPGLLPTPAAGNFNDGESVESWQARKERELAKGRNGNGIGTPLGTPLGMAVRMLPTPTASDRFGPGGHGDGGADLRTTVNLLPTPQARDGDESSRSVHRPTAERRWAQGKRCLEDGVALLPTPKASDGEKGGPNQRGSSGDLTLPSAVMPLLPTPTVEDAGRMGSQEWADRWASGETIPETQQRLRTRVLRLPGATTNPPSDAGS
jgi:hypothetical protein